jgi:hypothetical protein
VADTREAAAPGPKASNQLAGMRPVTTEDVLGFCLNDLRRKLLREFATDDPRRGFVLTAIHALESI